MIARWESRGGRHWLELRRDASGGYGYSAVGASGDFGTFPDDASAIAFVERDLGWSNGTRWVDIHQPDANKTPMRRVS